MRTPPANSRTCLQEAQAGLLRQALTAWIELGILEHHKGQLKLAAKPVPITIPGGGTFDSFIDKADLKAMHTQAWAGRTFIISTPAEAADAISDILRCCSTPAAADGGDGESLPAGGPHGLTGLSAAQAASVVGFDLEFKPVYTVGARRSPPALIQIATPRAVYLFHIRAFMVGRMFRESDAAVGKALQVLRLLYP